MAILRDNDGAFYDIPDDILDQESDGMDTYELQGVDAVAYRVPATQAAHFKLAPDYVEQMMEEGRAAMTAVAPPPPGLESPAEQRASEQSGDGSPRAYCGHWRNYWRNYWRNCWRNCY